MKVITVHTWHGGAYVVALIDPNLDEVVWINRWLDSLEPGQYPRLTKVTVTEFPPFEPGQRLGQRPCLGTMVYLVLQSDSDTGRMVSR